MEWEEIALEEYKTLRQESLESISQAQGTLRGGVVALGVLAGLAVGVRSAGEIAQVTLALAGPGIAVAVVMQWLLETLRSVRAGTHIAGLEQAIARHAVDAGLGDDPPLRWESQLRRQFSQEATFAYHWTVLLGLLAAALPTVALGLYALADDGEWGWFALGSVGDVALGFVTLRFLRRNHAEIKRLHQDPPAFGSDPGPGASAPGPQGPGG
jgi:hypothetical protein